MAKVLEAGLAAEPIQTGEQTLLTQNSSETDVGQMQSKTPGQDADHSSLFRVPTVTGDADVEKVASHDAENAGLPPVAATNEATLMYGIKLYLVFAAMMLGVFMFALDQSIVATAIPIFTSEFKAFEQVGWVVSGYFLTQCGLILLAGQLLTVVKPKWVLLVAFFFFELGSLICAVSKSMTIMIVGRAIQGVGAAAMFSSMMVVITMITRVEQRPAFLASFGFVFVISSVAGPLLGGVFTQHVSWRWCFWINLPVGGLAAIAVVFLLPAHPVHDSPRLRNKTMGQKLAGLDYIGSVMILGIVTCLLMALSDGGNKYAWSNWRIIFEFILAGVLVIVFAFWQLRLDERALIPKKVLKNRTLVAASVAIFMTMLVMLGITYQLPLYYEAVKNHSPTKAGIDIIPAMLSVCIGIFISGGGTQATGRYYPWLLVGPPLAAVGAGLLSTMTAQTSGPKLIGYQILCGFGIGLSFQNILLSVQAEFATRPEILPNAVTVSNAFQLLGGALGVGIVNTVQSVYLNRELREKAPDVPFELVRQSVTAIYQYVPESQRGPVIDAYVTAIGKSFTPIFISVALAFVASIFIRNHNLKERSVGGGMAV